MFSSANLFYGRCSDIIDLDQKKIHPMEKLGFFISYAKCLLDEQAPYGEVENCIKRAGQVIESSEEQFDNEPLLIELGLVRALNNYRGRHYEEACSESQEIMSNDLIHTGKIDLSNQPNGVYFLRIETPNGSLVKKLVKE